MVSSLDAFEPQVRAFLTESPWVCSQGFPSGGRYHAHALIVGAVELPGGVHGRIG